MNRCLTYSDYLFQKVLKLSKLTHQVFYTSLVALLGSILLALSSKVNFVLPFTPVPVTLQSFVVVLLSVLLGRRVMFVLFLYIFEGLTGLPVFAKGGGIWYLLGPTGGYIVGFLFAGYICGMLAEAGFCKNFINTSSMMFLGHLIIYFFGVLWLLRFVDFDVVKAISVGVLPFIPGDIIKVLIASAVLPVGWRKICSSI